MRKPGRAPIEEPSPGPAKIAVENTFARVLAHNDVKVRNKGVKKLRGWLQARAKPHKRTDMLKLWKGLFYCMWMSDKPLVQEHLAKTIGELVLCFRDDADAILFIDTFFATITREWHGIDRLRLDKYYILISQVVKHGLRRVCEDHDEQLRNAFLDVLRKGPLRVDKVPGPLGVLLHVCDTYLTLLAEATGDTGVDTSLHMALLAPVLDLMTSPDASAIIRTRVETAVLNKLTTHALPDEEHPVGSVLGEQEVDLDLVCEWLFARGADPNTADEAREHLYKARRRILNRRKAYLRDMQEKQRAEDGVESNEDDTDTAVGGSGNGSGRKRRVDEYAPPDLPEVGLSAKALKRRRKRAEKRAAKSLATNGQQQHASEEDSAGTTALSAVTKGTSMSKMAKKERAGTDAASTPRAAAPKTVKHTTSNGTVATPPTAATTPPTKSKSTSTKKQASPTTPQRTSSPTEVRAGKSKATSTIQKKNSVIKTPKVKDAGAAASVQFTAATAEKKHPAKLGSGSVSSTPAASPIKGILRSSKTPPSGNRISWTKNRLRSFDKKLPPSSVGRRSARIKDKK
eukprot:m.51743 g.51743  ORF g.51743 m.51743 type:complete len:571 (+) comp7330_c0_seq1:477-2189(+)